VKTLPFKITAFLFQTQLFQSPVYTSMKDITYTWLPLARAQILLCFCARAPSGG